MREHTYLSAMMGFMRNHVAEHLNSCRPGRRPAISVKLIDAAATAERFRQHLHAACGTLCQSVTGLLRRALGAVELSWKPQVRSREADPLRADIVHVGEDRRNSADLAGRFSSPGFGSQVLDQHLVHAVVGGKDPGGGLAGLILVFVRTCGRHLV